MNQNMNQNITLEIKNKLKDCLKCLLCNRILYQPITLHCQDTFCKPCLQKYNQKTKKNNCPKCLKPTFNPMIQNFKLCDLINKIFPQETKQRENEINIIRSKLTHDEKLKEDIREEIIKNNWRTIVNKTSTQNQTQNQQQTQNQIQQFFLETIF